MYVCVFLFIPQPRWHCHLTHLHMTHITRNKHTHKKKTWLVFYFFLLWVSLLVQANQPASVVFGWVVCGNWKLEIDENADSTHLPILHTPYPFQVWINPFLFCPLNTKPFQLSRFSPYYTNQIKYHHTLKNHSAHLNHRAPPHLYYTTM